ncbi:MAG: hypothetical protein WCX82_01550 [archaeon]|jgi:hypothetical protein
MIPDPRIIENIQKLKDLGMSKDDIKSNLIKMGLSSSDCDELIINAFNGTVEKKEEIIIPKPTIAKESNIANSVSKEEKIDTTELPDNLFDDDTDIGTLKDENQILDIKDTSKEIPDITKGLGVDELNYSESDYKSTIEESKPFYNLNNKAQTNSKNITTTPTNSDIWGSGLATTINSKLNEIDLKQAKMEEFLKLRIAEEIEKYKRIQETSKQLLTTKINEDVTTQTHEINTQLTRQLAQLKVEQIKINKKTEEITNGKKEIEELTKHMQSFQTQLVDQNTVSQENVNKIIATTTVKLNAKIKEINDILALQSRITQGLIKNTQTAIGGEITKLNEFKENIDKKINPQQLYDKLNQLELFKQQLANRYETRFENVKTEFLVKAREAFKDEINKDLKDIKTVRDTIVAKSDPELINKKIEELNTFQTHLLSAIDEKISQSLKVYESVITQEIKGKSNAIDEEIKKIENAMITLDLAKEKVTELNMFKDQFIAIIDKNIEKINTTFSLLENKIKEMEENQKKLM